ncbi:DUF5719 family protein [Streptomyces sp. NPDC049555]|uniref:DUF5719 family protein n=1 Tax=Streptomyces sp. NPDC049555 TaxID=3154930 RepID=UPI0034156693
MNRTTLSLFAATAGLAVITGIAALNPPSDGGRTVTKSVGRLPVQRSTLLCPAPTSSDVGQTTYTAFTPPGKGTAGSPAELLPAAGPARTDAGKSDGKDSKDSKDAKAKEPKGSKETKESKESKEAAKDDPGKPVLSLKEAGKPVSTTTERSDAPALLGTADGALAPGWTAQQTTVVAAGSGRGLHGTACTPPDTSFWFPGVSTAKGRQDYVHLTNPDASAAVVDLELFGPEGRTGAASGEGVTVPPHATVPVLLSTLTDTPTDQLTLHVAARSGRVGAAVQVADDKLGGDWLPPSADAAPAAVLPGVPADATSVRLVAFAPGNDDADLSVRLAGPSGSISPAGHEALHVKAGMTTAVELGDVTRGEAGSLVLTGARGSAPIVAALRVTRGKDDKQETAFIPATPPVEVRGTVADNRPGAATLALTAPGRDAQVKVTSSAGSEGGTAVSKTYTVKAGTTLAVEPPRPTGGKGVYAVTVEKVSGGPVHASRMLALPKDGVPMFTVQPVRDDRSTVAVPETGQDLSVLTG